VKRLRIFLVNVGFSRPRYPQISPPMGVMYLAAYLRSRFDTDIRIVNQRLDNCSNEDLVRQVADFEADVVGLGALTPAAYGLAFITQAIRQRLPKALIVLGGPHISAFQAKALEGTMADAAVQGEGELAFEAIINAHFEGGGLADVPGAFWQDKGGEVVTNPGMVPHIEDLDSLPFPAYDLIDLSAYWRRQSLAAIPRRRYVSIFSSRGCPYGCAYCHNVFGKRFRPHSAQRIIEEILYYRRQYGINDIEFIDDVFNLDRKRLLEFCELIHRHNLRIKIVLPSGVRTDILKEDEIDALVSAGLNFSCFALESGSPRIQKLIGKNLNIPNFLKNVELATARGVHANGFAMFGFPTETETEMQQTVDVLCRSRLHTLSCFTVIPYPNTPLYRTAMETHPEQLAGLRYDGLGFINGTINLSDVPDDILFAYQRKANRRFYINPIRLLRILKDHPQPHLLPLYIPHVLQRFTKRDLLPS